MKKLNLVWVMLLCYAASSAQVITITDEQSGLPLEYVNLLSEAPSAFATTNAHGQADITSFSGSQQIAISLLGYASQVKTYAELEKVGFTLAMLRSAITVDPVVVSSGKWNEPKQRVPQRITQIDPKEMQLLNPQTTADMLGASGEVFIQKSQQGGGSPMIRGFSTNRLLYTIDGVRMNTAIFRSGNLQNVISLDPFAIEHSEILFGPGSVMYGSDAIGGVMSFQTLTPQLSLDGSPLVTGKAVTRFSSANKENTYHFDVNAGWTKWASVTSFTHSDYGDLLMGSNGPDEYLRPFYVKRIDTMDVVVRNDNPKVQVPSGYTQMNLMQKIRFSPNAKWDFRYGFHYSATSDYSRYDRHIRYRNGEPRYGEWSYGPQVWRMNQLSITHTNTTALYDAISLKVAHQYFEESRIDRDIQDPERHIRLEKVNAISLNLDLNKKLGQKTGLFYGLEVVQNDVNSTGTDENIMDDTSYVGPSRYPMSTWSSYAAYFTVRSQLSSKFGVSAGVRYNHFMIAADFTDNLAFYPFPEAKISTSGGAVTGSLGFVYRPVQKWAISLNAATGFRSPNIDDLGKVFDSEPGSVVVPNGALQAEYAYSVDLGVSGLIGKRLRVDVTGYYTILQNALVRRDFRLNGMDSIMYDGEMSKVQAIQNAAVANVYGIQAGFELDLPAGFGLMTRFNYQVGEEELDDGTKSPSRHAAPWFGVTRLTYNYGRFGAQFYSCYSGAKTFDQLPREEQGKTEIYAVDDQGRPWSPGWYTVNFKAMYNLTDVLMLSAGVENLTDQRYRPYSSGIVAPGRNLVISLRAGF